MIDAYYGYKVLANSKEMRGGGTLLLAAGIRKEANKRSRAH